MNAQEQLFSFVARFELSGSSVSSPRVFVRNSLGAEVCLK
jgi:hypothetical protein